MLQFKCPITLEISALLLNLQKEGLREIFEKKYLSLLQISETWLLMFWKASPELGMGLTPKDKFKHPCKRTLILCL